MNRFETGNKVGDKVTIFYSYAEHSVEPACRPWLLTNTPLAA